MKQTLPTILIAFLAISFFSCSTRSTDNKESNAHPLEEEHELAEFVNRIRVVDNHAHPNSIDPDDKGSDALPLDGLGNIELPIRVRPESPVWLEAARKVYGFTGAELNEQSRRGLADSALNMIKQKGMEFPAWALDKAGIEVMMGNRISMGPGLSAPRFRWVSYADAFLYPLSTKAEAALTPDREKLFPLEDQLFKKYLSDLHLADPPASLDDYLKNVVTATLEMQKKGGCLALKFEAAYLRSLHFEKSSLADAREVYAHYVHGGEPTHERYKLLQDYIFFYIAREAGRLGMPIHIHSFPGAGNYFVAADCDPLLLEPVFNDSTLRNTKFVLIHGGGTFSKHTSAMLWKPNVYADLSLMTQLWTPDQLAEVLKDWLSQFPEKILFGTDADGFGPGLGWEMSASLASTTGRQALTMALAGMIRNNDITLGRAEEIAAMVMRTNANNLYQLGLK
jgi:hypothetical protein